MAGKRFFAGMNPHVILQVGIWPCMKITHMAGVRFGVQFGGNFLILKQYRIYLIVSNHQLWYFFSPFSQTFSRKNHLNQWYFYLSKFLKKNSYILGSILWTFRRWAFKLEDWLQRYWHKWQANGFSPVWILMWICKLAYDLARKLHIWQAWGFVSDLEVIFWYWNNIGYTSLRVIINHYCEIFLPFFQAFLKPNWIMILYLSIFWKRQLYFGFDLVDFSLMPF